MKRYSFIRYGAVVLAVLPVLPSLARAPASAGNPAAVVDIGTCVAEAMAVMLRDPSKEAVIRDIYRRVKLEDKYGSLFARDEAALRRTLLAFTKDPEARKIFKAALMTDLRSQSREILKVVERATQIGKIDEATQVYDVFVIGAGPHDAIFTRTLKKNNPGLKTVTVEASDSVASNFDVEGFRLNSLNREGRSGQISQKGTGNQNELQGGVVQIPDLSPSTYPVAQDLADVTLFNRATVKDSPILFQTEVLAVEDRLIAGQAWPARYKITTNRGEFYSESIVNSTGLGRELNLPGVDINSLSLIETERAALAAGKRAQAMTVAEYFRLMESDPYAYKAFSGETVAVIGDGDSANTFLEHALGAAPEGSYGSVTAQDGRIAKAFWIGQTKDACEKFLTQTRPRYLDVLGGIKSKVIEPTPAKLASLTRLSNGKIEIVLTDGSRRTVDRVVLASGFKDGSPEVFRKIAKYDASSGIPFKESSALVPLEVKGLTNFTPDRTPRDVIVGKRMAGGKEEHQIFFTAPSAGKLADDADLRGVSANSVSLFLNGPRTEALATAVSGRPARGLARFQPTVRKITAMAETGDSTRYVLTPTPATKVRAGVMADQSIVRAKFAAILRDVQVVNANSLEMSLQKAANGKWVASFKPALDPVASEMLARKLVEDPALLQDLNRVLPKDAVNNLVVVKATLKNGVVARSEGSLQVKYARSRETIPNEVVAIENPRLPAGSKKVLGYFEEKEMDFLLAGVTNRDEVLALLGKRSLDVREVVAIAGQFVSGRPLKEFLAKIAPALPSKVELEAVESALLEFFNRQGAIAASERYGYQGAGPRPPGLNGPGTGLELRLEIEEELLDALVPVLKQDDYLKALSSLTPNRYDTAVYNELALKFAKKWRPERPGKALADFFKEGRYSTNGSPSLTEIVAEFKRQGLVGDSIDIDTWINSYTYSRPNFSTVNRALAENGIRVRGISPENVYRFYQSARGQFALGIDQEISLLRGMAQAKIIPGPYPSGLFIERYLKLRKLGEPRLTLPDVVRIQEILKYELSRP